jgi:class 3 adenylate cyclase
VEIPEWLLGHRLGELLEAVTTREAEKRDLSVEALLEALDAIARGELPVAPEASKAPAPLAERGERRHLTVLFCDLVGSSALAQRVAAEAYRRVVQAYHARAAQAIARCEGQVAQYLGDGLLVYFGYPQAHEDDAERAVRAGREILRELQILNPRLEAEHGVRLQARVGIHAGPVVVGEMGGGEKAEMLALGDTLNVAARLEGSAEPDTLVISDATLRLVAGLFVTQNRGNARAQGHLHADPGLPGDPAERGREPARPRAPAHALRGARAGAGSPRVASGWRARARGDEPRIQAASATRARPDSTEPGRSAPPLPSENALELIGSGAFCPLLAGSLVSASSAASMVRGWRPPFPRPTRRWSARRGSPLAPSPSHTSSTIPSTTVSTSRSPRSRTARMVTADQRVC